MTLYKIILTADSKDGFTTQINSYKYLVKHHRIHYSLDKLTTASFPITDLDVMQIGLLTDNAPKVSIYTTDINKIYEYISDMEKRITSYLMSSINHYVDILDACTKI